MRAVFQGCGLDGVSASVQLDVRNPKVDDTVYVVQITNLQGMAPGKARPIIRDHKFRVTAKAGNEISLFAFTNGT